MSEDEKKPTKKPLLPEIFSDENFNNGLKVSATVVLFIGVFCWLYYSYYDWLAIKLHITLEWDKATIIQIAIAVTAFFTLGFTAWQRILNTKQQEIQIEQLKLGNKQFKNATDNLVETQNNNIAKLLVDGTKLLGNDTSEAEKAAGVACMSYIMETSPNFAKQASMSLQIFIKNINKIANGIDITKNEYMIFALDALNKYAEKCSVLINLKRVTVINDAYNTIDVFWPNIVNINYRNFKFRNISFNESIANFYIENCFFFKCKINSLNITQAIPETRDIPYFNTETGEIEYDTEEIYNYPSSFSECIFDDGENSEESFLFINETMSEQQHDYHNNCLYNDQYIKSYKVKKFFSSNDIKPLSSLTAEERLQVGPQKTT